jgi:hypothetical protein
VTPRRRLEAFLYSRRNIAGSLLALGGLGLVATGVIAGPLALPVVGALYAIGVLVVPPERGLDVQLDAAQDTAKVRSGLDQLIRQIQGRVAPDIFTKVVSIRDSILQTLPSASAVDVGDPNVYLIQQTALSYLPQALNSYLAVPRTMAEHRAIADGRTPHDVLLEQLDLMDSKMQEVADDIARNDTDKLLANGRFIAERFGSSSLDLGAIASSAAPPAPAAPAAPAAAPTTIQQPAEASAPAAEAEQVEERERVH